MSAMRWLCAAALVCASHLGAQQKGTYSSFGHGCGAADNAVLVTQGLPLIGQTFYVWMRPTTSLAGPRTGSYSMGSFDWLITGASKTSWKGYPLPLHDQPYLGGCSLLVSLDVVHMSLSPPGRNTASTSVFAVAVPNDLSLAGADFYQQCVSWSASQGSNGFRCLVTHGGHGIIGR